MATQHEQGGASPYTIRTNGHAYPILSWEDLTKKEQAFNDWGAEEHSFVRYRGQCIPLENFMRTTDIPGWDGVAGDSYFSGVSFAYWRDEFGRIDSDRCKLGLVTW